jgi:hypothetical protein
MQMKLGNYGFPINGVEFSERMTILRTEATVPWGYRAEMSVHGYLEGNGQTDLSNKEEQLKLALRTPYKDLVFYTDDGKPTSAKMLNSSNCLTGVVTTEAEFPSNVGAEWSSQREFRFSASADYTLPGFGNQLVSFKETVTYRGGDALYRVLPAINGILQKQLIYPKTPYEVTQSGESIGLLDYPVPPPPALPLLQPRVITRTGPDKAGPNFYKNYRVTWEYVYGDVVPITILPNPWKG